MGVANAILIKAVDATLTRDSRCDRNGKAWATPRSFHLVIRSETEDTSPFSVSEQSVKTGHCRTHGPCCEVQRSSSTISVRRDAQ